MVGQQAENFSLKDEGGRVFDLYENLDKKVLLVFYPKDNSPVCTMQLSDYTENKDKFLNEGIKIVGINPASAGKHKSFCVKAGIDIPLLADEDKVVCKKFGAVNFLGGTKRKLVLIGNDKKILYEKNIFPVHYLNTAQIFDSLKESNIIRPQ